MISPTPNFHLPLPDHPRSSIRFGFISLALPDLINDCRRDVVFAFCILVLFCYMKLHLHLLLKFFNY